MKKMVLNHEKNRIRKIPKISSVWERVKHPFLPKIRKSSLLMAGLVTVFFLALGCGAIFAEETEPQNPLAEETAEFDGSALLLDCESEEDGDVYIPVPIAAEPDPSEQQQETDESLNPEEEEPEEEEEEPEEDEPEEEEEETPPPETKENPSQIQTKTPAPSARVNPDAPTVPGNNGTAGGDQPNGKVDNTVYFTTSIKDGETVTDPNYSFKIKHVKENVADKGLKVKEEKVYVNGELTPQFHGTVILTKEGANTIRVAVDYMDPSGKIMASPYKDYTVNMDTQSLAISTTLENKTVAEDRFSFEASASYKGEAAELTVKMNGTAVEPKSGNQYGVVLKEGSNTFELEAKGGGLTKKASYTVTYENDGVFDIRTDLTDGMTVTDANLSFQVWLRNAPEGKVVVTVNNKTVKGENGSYSTILNYGKNTVKIVAKNGGESKTLNLTVYFQRPEASEDNPIPDVAHAPTISYINVTDGQTIKSSVLRLDILAADYHGNRLYSDCIAVEVNGFTVFSKWENETATTYPVEFTPGENVVKVRVTDKEGYNVLYIYKLTYEATDGPIGKATVSVEAATLGLGYLIPPTEVDIYNDESAAYVLARLFDQYGIVYNDGNLADQFYLARIFKDGIMNSYHIPDNLVIYLEEAAIAESGQYDPNSLGEKDIYDGSGWMYAVNGLYSNYSISTVRLVDGDVLTVRFTLALGMDIAGSGGAGGGSDFPESFIMEP